MSDISKRLEKIPDLEEVIETLGAIEDLVVQSEAVLFNFLSFLALAGETPLEIKIEEKPVAVRVRSGEMVIDWEADFGTEDREIGLANEGGQSVPMPMIVTDVQHRGIDFRIYDGLSGVVTRKVQDGKEIAGNSDKYLDWAEAVAEQVRVELIKLKNLTNSG